MSKQTPATALAQALMLEQVQFIKKQLIDAQHKIYIHHFIHQLYIQSDHIQLNEVILLEQLHSVVHKYAFNLNLGSALLEFIGFVAQKIHHIIVHSDSSIEDLISDASFKTWMNKLLELEQIRYYIQQNLSQNPKAQEISLQLANQILEHNTPWLNHLRKMTLNNHHLGSKLVNFVQDQQQSIELKLEKQLAQVILKQLGYLITLPSEELAELSLDIWSEIKTQKFKDVFSQINAMDVEDFFILIYETWKTLRQTSELQSIIFSVVDAFYDYFGDYSLQELLLAVGIKEADLYAEADRFVPSTLQALDTKKLLDPLIQALIEPFYTSSEALHLIQNHVPQDPRSI